MVGAQQGSGDPDAGRGTGGTFVKMRLLEWRGRNDGLPLTYLYATCCHQFCPQKAVTKRQYIASCRTVTVGDDVWDKKRYEKIPGAVHVPSTYILASTVSPA